MGKNESWQDLLRDFLNTPAAHGFSGSDKGGLERYLAAPAAIARWIEEFAPELKKRNSLRIVISGAAQDAVSYDMGRWYQFLPFMLGAPAMKVRVALVGKELAASQPSAAEADMKAAVASVSAASIHDCTLAEYMDTFRWQPDPELVFLFHPELGAHDHSWLVRNDIRPFLEIGIPVGACAHTEDEVAMNAEPLGDRGYAVYPRTAANPFAGAGASVHCAFGRVLWRFASLK